MAKEKFDFQFLGLKILIYGGTIAFFLFQWFGPGLIKAYKDKKERELILHGGSVSEANTTIQKRNEKLIELNKLENKEAKKYNNLLVFTNDTTKTVTTLLQANRKYRDNYKNPYSIGYNTIQKNEEDIDYINDFFNRKDSLGFNIYVLNAFKNQEVKLMQTNAIDTNYRFKVSYFYYYTEKQKKRLAKRINEKPNNHFSFSFESKEKKLAKLDSIQFSKIILSESELKDQKIKQSGLIKLFAPRISPDNYGVFYFSCYNKPIDSITFHKNITSFTSMFLKDLKGKHNGKVKQFTVKENQLDYE
ncbi:hypothetical protein [Tenacibaculum jejuense]|uniref:Uncharacterized protein n=1 Tax=Tenacibaculum jejuense TaxID=584609 RepID=A0A238UBE8_9FLAO|nr:hypothetical protein [Tenacibaculum jejuense]SNR16412.1 protein of unknown function [Tenacibaculum jejuense]